MQDFPAISNHYTTSMPELEDAQSQFERELVQWMGERSSFTVLPSIYIRFMFFLTRWNHPSIIVWVVFNEGWGEYKAAEVNQSDI